MSDRVTLEDLRIGMRLLWTLPSFLRRPITEAEARAGLRKRLERRTDRFLTFARSCIYEYPESPYRGLLKLAGCEFGDLEALARKAGVEGALRELLSQGVYFTVDELKGRKPVVRGNTSIEISPERFANPATVSQIRRQTGGSRGAASTVSLNVEFLRTMSEDVFLALEARGGFAWVHALWSVPGSTALNELLRQLAMGVRPVRWFSQVDVDAAGLHARYRWSARVMSWESRLLGIPLPSPEHVPLDDPHLALAWLADVLERGGVPHLYGLVSSAVEVCKAARKQGRDLTGAQFSIGGEPLTPARLAVIRSVGAEAVPLFGTTEAGRIAYGCLAADLSDDIHLFHDLHALVQPEAAGGDRVPADSLFISSLVMSAPVVLLNVSLGDCGLVSERRCGCPLQDLGWQTHLAHIFSPEKVTAGGVNFLDTDLIRLLEEVLPRRFGGAPTDYQLVEANDEGGNAQLRLLVHPSLGPLPEGELARAFLDGLGVGSGAEKVVEQLWRQREFLRVERTAPLSTAAGKILHLHVERRN